MTRPSSILLASLSLMLMICLMICTAQNGVAAIPKNSPPKPMSFIKEGRLMGGSLGSGEVSLLALDRKFNPKQKTERIFLSFGDGKGYPRSTLGYYHIAVESDPPRIVLDLSRMQKTAVSELAIREIFKGSAFIESTVLTMDPEDHSTNLTLRLSQAVEVASVERRSPRGGAQLVLALRPTGRAAKDGSAKPTQVKPPTRAKP